VVHDLWSDCFSFGSGVSASMPAGITTGAVDFSGPAALSLLFRVEVYFSASFLVLMAVVSLLWPIGDHTRIRPQKHQILCVMRVPNP
jgi:hypothetical protein